MRLDVLAVFKIFEIVRNFEYWQISIIRHLSLVFYLSTSIFE